MTCGSVLCWDNMMIGSVRTDSEYMYLCHLLVMHTLMTCYITFSKIFLTLYATTDTHLTRQSDFLVVSSKLGKHFFVES